MAKSSANIISKKKTGKIDPDLLAVPAEVILKKVEELKLNKKNYRIHNDRQISQLMASISEFGFTNPLLVDESNLVLAGHGRLEAAKRLKFKRVVIERK